MEEREKEEGELQLESAQRNNSCLYIESSSIVLSLSHPPLSQGDSDESEFELSDAEDIEEEDDSLSDSGAESSEWEEPGRGRRRVQQKDSWLVSGSDSDYRPGEGGGGRGKRRRQPQNRNHWKE